VQMGDLLFPFTAFPSIVLVKGRKHLEPKTAVYLS
jgi:hypothetical protein